MTHKTTKIYPSLILIIIMLVAGFLAIGDNARAQDELEADQPLGVEKEEVVTIEVENGKDVTTIEISDDLDSALAELELVTSELESIDHITSLHSGGHFGRALISEETFLPFMLPIFFIFVVMGVAAFSLIWRALFPRRAEWTREIVQRMPVGSFWFGLGAFIVTFILIALFANAGEGGGMLAVLILAAFLLLLGTFKITAMVGWVGDVIDPASTGIRHALYGASALMLLLVIPILGWLVLFGLACIGVGAALMSYIPARRMTDQPSIPTDVGDDDKPLDG